MIDHVSIDNVFALFFTVRTGSHLCKSALLSHPDVEKFWVESETNKEILFGKEPIFPWVRFTGFKLASAYLHEKGRIAEITCPKIATYRHNKLTQYISFLLAEREERWQDFPYRDDKIYVPIGDGIWYIKTWIAAENAIKEIWGDDVLWLEYGELVTGSCFEAMQRHLGLPVAQIQPFHRKQSNKPLIEYVENADELLNSPLAGWV